MLILTALVMVFVLVACTPKENAPATTENQAANTAEQPAAGEEEITREQLATFNGKDGNKAYVAVDGVVYDVTDAPEWKDGAHNGFEAGNDLTAEIKEKSPHGVAKLEGLPVVGKLVD